MKYNNCRAGLCLILALTFLLVSDLLQTRNPSMNIRQLLDIIAANQVSNEIAFAFAIYGFTLMVPAVIRLDRRSRFGRIGLN